jgi:PT repeat/Tyrosine-protein kinase ephrin type A/B receptor-like
MDVMLDRVVTVSPSTAPTQSPTPVPTPTLDWVAPITSFPAVHLYDPGSHVINYFLVPPVYGTLVLSYQITGSFAGTVINGSSGTQVQGLVGTGNANPLHIYVKQSTATYWYIQGGCASSTGGTPAYNCSCAFQYYVLSAPSSQPSSSPTLITPAPSSPTGQPTSKPSIPTGHPSSRPSSPSSYPTLSATLVSQVSIGASMTIGGLSADQFNQGLYAFTVAVAKSMETTPYPILPSDVSNIQATPTTYRNRRQLLGSGLAISFAAQFHTKGSSPVTVANTVQTSLQSSVSSGAFHQTLQQTNPTAYSTASVVANSLVVQAPVIVVAPSSIPTSQPSNKPSMRPTGQPSRRPSHTPSSQPSSQPSRNPHSRPTGQPSRQPSSHPSRQPVSRPSSKPSRQPSAHPSSNPSRQPLAHPSTQPSRRPSSLPSSQPRSRPSSQPTTQPSGHPTSHPTAVCKPGEQQYYNHRQLCKPCAPGSYSTAYGSTACTVAAAGTYTPGGLATFFKCPIGFYNPETNSTSLSACLVCPYGRSTALEGTANIADCISPLVSFVAAFVTLFLAVVLLARYAIGGRFHRVAFLRRLKVRIPLIDQCKVVIRKIAIYTVLYPMEPRNLLNDRPRLKVFLFIFCSLIVGLIAFVFHYLSFFLQIFFVAMIIFRLVALLL